MKWQVKDERELVLSRLMSIIDEVGDKFKLYHDLCDEDADEVKSRIFRTCRTRKLLPRRATGFRKLLDLCMS